MKSKEKHNIECKGSWRDQYLRWICSFANIEGGKLVIGKNDRGGVVGVKDADKLLRDIPNKVRDILGIPVAANLCNRTAVRSEKGSEERSEIKVGEALTGNQQRIRVLLRQNSRLSTRQLSAGMVFPAERSSRILPRELQLLKRVGPAKGGHWEVLK